MSSSACWVYGCVLLVVVCLVSDVNGQTYPYKFTCTNDGVNHPGKQCARVKYVDDEVAYFVHDAGLPNWHHQPSPETIWVDPNWTVDYFISTLNSTILSYGRVLWWYSGNTISPRDILINPDQTLSYYGFGSNKNDFAFAPHIEFPLDTHAGGDLCTGAQEGWYFCSRECQPHGKTYRCTSGSLLISATDTGDSVCSSVYVTGSKGSAIVGSTDLCVKYYGFPIQYTCQRLSDMFGAYSPYVNDVVVYQYLTHETGQPLHTPQDTQYRQLWTQLNCTTNPTCQGMADVFDTKDGSWGVTPTALQSYWTSHCSAANCPTLGTSTGGACTQCGTSGCVPFFRQGTVHNGCSLLETNMTSVAFTITPAQQTWYNSNCNCSLVPTSTQLYSQFDTNSTVSKLKLPGPQLTLNGHSFTLAAYVKINSATYSGYHWNLFGKIYSLPGYTANDKSVCLEPNSALAFDYNAVWYFTSSTGLSNLVGSSCYHHIAFTYDVNTHINTIYLDGVSVATSTFTQGSDGSGAVLTIGNDGLDYSLRDLRYYSTDALTSTQILTEINNCHRSPLTGCI